jgi:hypothetical protein
MRGSFKTHPDSVARRIEEQQLKDAERRLDELADHPEEDEGPAWLDITTDSSPEEVESASASTPSSHLGLVALDWELASDDAAFAPMTGAESGQPDWKFLAGSPRHLHAETDIDGARIHVDGVCARKHGPGRSITEIRIFVDGCLAGRGGKCGCALGFGKGELPAVALLGGGKALTVDDVTDGALHAKRMPELVAELRCV